MFRVKISSFIKNNKNKIKDLSVKLIMLAIVIFVGILIFTSFADNEYNQKDEEKTETYKPKESVIKGKDVSETQYKKDVLLVDTFLEYCNNKQVEEAYSLLSDGCKEKIYKTLEVFKIAYYDKIFSEKKQYNLQTWISTNKYTVYKIRYTNNILATGEYHKENIFQDYITLIKGTDTDKISIGKYILTEELNTKTVKEDIEITVLKRHIYLESEEYEIKVTNRMQTTIMLDTLESNQTIKLICKSNGAYDSYSNKLFKSEVTIEPSKTRILNIEFNKPSSSSKKSHYIKFFRVIKNYEEYINDKINYKDAMEIDVKI